MGFDRKISAVRRKGIGGRAITFLLLLAFAFQSYLTQTHVHWTSGTPTPTCVSKCVVHTPLPLSPFGEAADCPLCQVVVHSGAFFAPAILAVAAPYLWVESLSPAERDFLLRAAPVRNGLSRAPPPR